jgi:predicted ArsR family transcriptional regulator
MADREVASAETAAGVLSYLRANTNTSGLLSVSRQDLSDELEVGLTTVAKAVRSLIRGGWISVYRKGSGPGYPTMYQITHKSDGGVA